MSVPWRDTHAARRVLEAMRHTGLLTVRQAVLESGLSEKQVRNVLAELLEAEEPPVRQQRIRLFPAPGRPPEVYLLTAAGARHLRQQFPEQHVPLFESKDPTRLRHALAAAHVVWEARRHGWDAAMERPVDQALRADVLLRKTSLREQVIIEIEQQARAVHLKRIVEKLQRLQQYFRQNPRSRISLSVRILFLIPHEDQYTLRTWRRALAALEEDALFFLYWQHLDTFLENPSWDSLKNFHMLTPLRESPAEGDATPPPGKSVLQALGVPQHPEQHGGDMLHLLRALWTYYQEQLADVGSLETVERLLEIVTLIYLASHDPDSRVRLYGALPVASLTMLRHYLHAPQNAHLKQEVIAALALVRRQAGRGLNQYLNALTRLAWDGFLRPHGIGRGGPIQVTLHLPVHGAPHEFRYQVHLERRSVTDDLMDSRSREVAAEALAWVLQALLLYPYELGLQDSRWGKKRAKKGSTA